MSNPPSKELLRCYYCDAKPMRKDNLERHIANAHPGNPVRARPPPGTVSLLNIFGKRPRADEPAIENSIHHTREQIGSDPTPASLQESLSLSSPCQQDAVPSSSSSSSSSLSTLVDPADPHKDPPKAPAPPPLESRPGVPPHRTPLYPVASLRNQEQILAELASLKASVTEVIEAETGKRAKSDFTTAVKSISSNFRVCWTSNQVICTTCERFKPRIHSDDLPADFARVGVFDIGLGAIPTAGRRRTILKSLERHEAVETHRRCNEMAQREKRDMNKTIRMNVARAAYVTIVENDSYSRFERTLAMMGLAGAAIGDLNHSRKFLPSFAIAMKEELIGRLAYIFTSPQTCFGNRPSPFGAATDKVTVSRRTLQPASIYTLVRGRIQHYLIGAPPATIKTGAGLAKLLYETIIAVGIDTEFIRGFCVSLSTDGEYVNLRFGDRFADIVGIAPSSEHASPQLYHGWDVAHRLELCHADAHKLIDIRTRLHDEILPKHGAGYERVREAAEELGVRYYAPVSYCKTRWCSSEYRVLLNFKHNLKAIHRSDNNNPRAKYLEYTWVFAFHVMLDVLTHMSNASLVSQTTSLRPWQVWKALCTYRDNLIVGQAELTLLAEKAQIDAGEDLTPKDFDFQSFPLLGTVDFTVGTWNGLELWHAPKYTTAQVIAYSASQAVSWIEALIHALGRRIFNDIPHWLKKSEYVFSGAGLLGNNSIEKLRWEYDKPVELGDGAVDPSVADKTEVIKELTQSVADYTGEDLNPELVVEQYLHLQEKLQEMVKECGPGSVAMTSLWEKAHSISAIYNGAKDLLWVACHFSLKASTESVVESQCSTLGSVSVRRHLSAEARANTGLLAWNKIPLDHLQPFLEGALNRLPKSFTGFQRTGKFYRNQKHRFSKVVDRILADQSRLEITSVPFDAIKRAPRENTGPATESSSDGSSSENDDESFSGKSSS